MIARGNVFTRAYDLARYSLKRGYFFSYSLRECVKRGYTECKNQVFKTRWQFVCIEMANFLFNYSCIVLNGQSFKLIFLCSLGSTIHTCCGWKARHQRHILRCVNCINVSLKQKGQRRSQGHFSPTPKGGAPVNSVSPAPHPNKLEGKGRETLGMRLQRRGGKRNPGNEVEDTTPHIN